jgi:glutathione S-transferase
MLKLYYIPNACSMACHIALEEAGAEYEGVAMDYMRGDHLTPDYLKINPKGFVAALLTDKGAISENAAILAYIAQAFPEANLAPRDPFGFGQVQAFNIFLSSAVHITYRHLSKPMLFADGEVARAALKAKVPEMVHKYYGLIEKQLADGRPWIHGEQYTISDPYLFMYTSYLEHGDRGNRELFPLARAHRKRVLARPATQAAIAAEGHGDPGAQAATDWEAIVVFEEGRSRPARAGGCE